MHITLKQYLVASMFAAAPTSSLALSQNDIIGEWTCSQREQPENLENIVLLEYEYRENGEFTQRFTALSTIQSSLTIFSSTGSWMVGEQESIEYSNIITRITFSVDLDKLASGNISRFTIEGGATDAEAALLESEGEMNAFASSFLPSSRIEVTGEGTFSYQNYFPFNTVPVVDCTAL